MPLLGLTMMNPPETKHSKRERDAGGRRAQYLKHGDRIKERKRRRYAEQSKEERLRYYRENAERLKERGRILRAARQEEERRSAAAARVREAAAVAGAADDDDDAGSAWEAYRLAAAEEEEEEAASSDEGESLGGDDGEGGDDVEEGEDVFLPVLPAMDITKIGGDGGESNAKDGHDELGAIKGANETQGAKGQGNELRFDFCGVCTDDKLEGNNGVDLATYTLMAEAPADAEDSPNLNSNSSPADFAAAMNMLLQRQARAEGMINSLALEMAKHQAMMASFMSDAQINIGTHQEAEVANHLQPQDASANPFAAAGDGDGALEGETEVTINDGAADVGGQPSPPPDDATDRPAKKDVPAAIPCNIEGCPRRAQNEEGFCFRHGATKNERACSREGCLNLALRRGLCSAHGYPKKKPRLCRREGCTNQAQYGGICFRHGSRRKPCRVEGCENQRDMGGVCHRHGARHFRTVKQCGHPGCFNQVQFGGVCYRHGAKRARSGCTYEGCENLAVSAKKGMCRRHLREMSEAMST